MNGLHIIWFRNDLRVHDHAALRGACYAAERDGGEVLALFIDAPERGADADPQHLLMALGELRTGLEQRGALLHIREGQADEVLSDLHRLHGVRSLHTHELPYDDLEAAPIESWALRAGVAFQVYPQFGPGTAPDAFTSSQDHWTEYMARPRFETPEITAAANVGIGRGLLSGEEAEPGAVGGRREAIRRFRDFLGSVSDPQRIAITEADSGAAFYAQLKPFLRLGVLSVREVWQAATSAHHQMLEAGQDIRAASIKSLLRRLPDLHQTHPPLQGSRQVRNAHGRPSRGQQLSLGL